MTALPEALVVAQRVRGCVASLRLTSVDSAAMQVTVNVGAATANPKLESLQAVLNEANHAMYQAKSAGRDRVASAGERAP